MVIYQVLSVPHGHARDHILRIKLMNLLGTGRD